MAEPKKKKSGEWELRTRYKDPITNEWREKKFTDSTRKKVKEKETVFLNSLLNNEILEDITLIDFYDTWMNTFKKGNVSTIRMQKIMLVKRNLEEFFGKKQTLRRIDKIKYQKFINWLGNDLGLSKETVSNRHAIVNSMFIEAYDIGYIRKIPSKKIKLTGQIPVSKSSRTMSLDDLKTFKTYLTTEEPDSNANIFVLTQIYSGARYSEVAALTWNDVDYENQQLIISKAFEYTKERQIKDPKSQAGYRNIDIDVQLLKLLKRHRAKQGQLVLSHKLRNPNNYVFVNNTNGMPISNTFVNNYIKEICERAEIPRISSHTLRHARTDFLILSGADPLYIKDQLGHEDIQTTLRHYASLSKELRVKSKDAVKALESELF